MAAKSSPPFSEDKAVRRPIAVVEMVRKSLASAIFRGVGRAGAGGGSGLCAFKGTFGPD